MSELGCVGASVSHLNRCQGCPLVLRRVLISSPRLRALARCVTGGEYKLSRIGASAGVQRAR